MATATEGVRGDSKACTTTGLDCDTNKVLFGTMEVAAPGEPSVRLWIITAARMRNSFVNQRSIEVRISMFRLEKDNAVFCDARPPNSEPNPDYVTEIRPKWRGSFLIIPRPSLHDQRKVNNEMTRYITHHQRGTLRWQRILQCMQEIEARLEYAWKWIYANQFNQGWNGPVQARESSQFDPTLQR
jgi:hypothetical protein